MTVNNSTSNEVLKNDIPSKDILINAKFFSKIMNALENGKYALELHNKNCGTSPSDDEINSWKLDLSQISEVIEEFKSMHANVIFSQYLASNLSGFELDNNHFTAIKLLQNTDIVFRLSNNSNRFSLLSNEGDIELFSAEEVIKYAEFDTDSDNAQSIYKLTWLEGFNRLAGQTEIKNADYFCDANCFNSDEIERINLLPEGESVTFRYPNDSSIRVCCIWKKP